MRYMLATLLAVGIGIATVVSPALAQVNQDGNFVNQYGNTVVPRYIGTGDHAVCYVDGVAQSCIQPAPVTLYPASGSGAVAGAPATVSVDTSRESSNR